MEKKVTVYVNYDLSIVEALNATGCSEMAIGDGAFKALSKGKNGKVEVTMSKIDKYLSVAELAIAYRDKRLKPVDLYTLAHLNKPDSKGVKLPFQFPNVTYWQDDRGKYWVATFDTFLAYDPCRGNIPTSEFMIFKTSHDNLPAISSGLWLVGVPL